MRSVNRKTPASSLACRISIWVLLEECPATAVFLIAVRKVDLVELPASHREDFNHRLVGEECFLGIGLGIEVGGDDAVVDGHCGNVVLAHDLLQLFGLR